MFHPSDPSYFCHSNNIWRGIHIIKILIFHFFQLPVTSSFLGQNILHGTLFWNTLSLCFSTDVRPSFTQIQNNRQNYGFTYFDLYVSREQMETYKTRNWMVACISRIYCALNLFVNAVLICSCRSQIFELLHICNWSVSYIHFVLFCINVIWYQHILSFFYLYL
jgi:hypothetical protein